MRDVRKFFEDFFGSLAKFLSKNQPHFAARKWRYTVEEMQEFLTISRRQKVIPQRQDLGKFDNAAIQVFDDGS